MTTPGIRWIVAAGAAIVSLAVAGSAGASMPPDVTLPAFQSSDHAQVIAQRVVTFTDGEQHWQLTSHAPGATPSAITTTGPSFLLNPIGPPVLHVAADGWTTLLDTGQADFVAAGRTVNVSAPVEEPATLVQLSIESGTGTDSFTPGASTRDVELWRDVLAPGEGLSLTAEVSAVVLATDGAVDANGTTVPPGVTAALTGELTVVNRTTVPAAVVIGVVGAEVATTTGVVDSEAPSTAPSTAPATSAGPASTAAPATTAAPTTPPTTIDPTLDTDADGLYDVEEINDVGSDPNAFDTDGDGLPDGDDLKTFGCSPTNADSDGDGLDDQLDEIDYALDCSNPDVDGDGFNDGAEIAAGTNAKDANDHP